MAGGVIVVLPLLGDYGRDGGNRCWIATAQDGELMLKMPKHYALHGHRSGCNGICPEYAGDRSKCEPANATEPIAATTTLPTTLQLPAKDSPVPLLVPTEFREFMDHFPRGEPGHGDLARVDADGAMLAGMIDLDNAVAEISGVLCHRCLTLERIVRPH